MTELRFPVAAAISEFPATRAQGRQGRDHLDAKLDATHVDLTIDFEGVTAMTFSFVDEFLGKFLMSCDASVRDLTIKLVGLSAESLEEVDVCLERRGTQAVAEIQGSLVLRGDQILVETFNEALRQGEFKAGDLAEAMSLSASNANNRLKRLADVGALRKSRTTGSARGGKEFTYAVVAADSSSRELASA